MVHIGRYELRAVEVMQEKFCQPLSNPAVEPVKDTVCAFYLLSGQISYDGPHAANAGDLLIATSAQVANIVSDDARALVFIMPNKQLRHILKDQEIVRISRNQLLAPLANCLSFISHRMSSVQKDEFEALYLAAIGLLPLATMQARRRSEQVVSPLAIGVLDYVDQQLQDPFLNASKVALQFGISERYVHKVFARQGLTMGAYIKTKRLEQAHFDLSARASRGQKISVVAKKWGFTDLSTFSRAFKAKYGYKPSHARFQNLAVMPVTI